MKFDPGNKNKYVLRGYRFRRHSYCLGGRKLCEMELQIGRVGSGLLEIKEKEVSEFKSKQ